MKVDKEEDLNMLPILVSMTIGISIIILMIYIA
jgi:hypothetical protein